MRLPLALLLATTTLAACHRAPTGSAGAVSREGLGMGARTVAGRAVVRWKSAAARAAWVGKLGLSAAPESLGGGDELLRLPAGLDVATLAGRLAGAADVEADFVARLGEPAPAPGGVEVAEDAVAEANAASKQYALSKVRAAEAWRSGKGSAQVPVAVIDTGVDLQHPDLVGKVVASESFVGLGAKLGLASAKDDNGHGTHCAGVVAAEGQVKGIAPGCPLFVAKALDRTGSGAMSDVAKALRWSVARGAKVVSLSLGSPDDARPLRLAVAEAIAAGVVVVAAMGNEGKAVRNYPAAYPGVIAVGATNRNDRVSSFSTRGPWISLCAPGAAILSTAPTYAVPLSVEEAHFGPRLGTLSGTSMATPLVAGVAALLMSKHPDWSPAQVKARLEQTAVPIAGASTEATGRGRMDAAAALN